MKKKSKFVTEEDREKRWKEIDRKFQEMKRRAEIKERYGVFTQQMFEELLEQLRVRIREDLTKELQRLDDKLDWLIGAYKKFDEEQTLLSGNVSNHTDNLEVINEKLGIQP